VIEPAKSDRRSWLAVIDAQRIFADEGSPWAAPGFAGIVAPVTRLVDGFGDRATFTRFVAPREPHGAWRSYYEDWPFALVSAADPLYQLVPAFAAFAADAVTATTFGKWDVLARRIADRTGTPDRVGTDDRAGTNDRAGTDDRATGVDRLVVCGVSTDCCVLSTVLAAADAGVEVLVVADACAGATEQSHQRALDAMSLYTPLVRIVSTDQVLAEVIPAAHPSPVSP
jgi:nicotinamidase-related amidase